MESRQPMADTCDAQNRSGKPCARPQGWGTDHPGVGRCKHHGGATPNGQLSGVVELARRDMVVMGRPLDVSPHEAILECIRITSGEVEYASDRVAELTEAFVDTMFGQQLHAWITVRQRSRCGTLQCSRQSAPCESNTPTMYACNSS